MPVTQVLERYASVCVYIKSVLNLDLYCGKLIHSFIPRPSPIVQFLIAYRVQNSKMNACVLQMYNGVNPIH